MSAFPSEQYRALRNRQLVAEITALNLYIATFCLVQYLMKEIPEDQSGAASVNLKAPKNVFASRLAVTLATLSRFLSRLMPGGVIRVSDKEVTLLDIDWLRKFVYEARPAYG